jgi:hypothetical protein
MEADRQSSEPLSDISRQWHVKCTLNHIVLVYSSTKTLPQKSSTVSRKSDTLDLGIRNYEIPHSLPSRQIIAMHVSSYSHPFVYFTQNW